MLFESLESNHTIHNLNLAWVQMGGGVGREDFLEPSFAKFCTFVKENNRLTHLNMTAVGLPEKLMLELICNIKRSVSLHCVHLCGNILTEASVDLLNLKLKPTLVNGMLAPEKIQ